MTNKKTNTSNVDHGRLLIVLEKFALFFFDAFISGVKKIVWKDSLTIFILFITVLLSFMSSYARVILLNNHPLMTSCLLIVSILVLITMLFGVPALLEKNKYQKNLDEIGLKTANGSKPQIVKVIKVDDYRVKLLIGAKGVGKERFTAKIDDLTSSFQKTIESISCTEDLKFIEIFLTTRKFPTKCPYGNLIESVDEPYNILIGESRKGIEQDSLIEAPHFLIAGSTGSGKSMFFNNCLLSLAKSTLAKEGKAAIQFYLLDLKNGIEVKPYENWPNVKIAKDEASSLKILKALVKEMKKRYVYLDNANGISRTINPTKHKKDILVLGIDEASVLFGKTSNKKKMILVNQCKDAFDELCKLARAGGIHIIAATQKPVKDALDTRALENLTGRVCFKMASSKGSELALGNGMASKLPDVKGRCIWRKGNNFVEVQAPYISDKQVFEECNFLAKEFSKIENGNYQEMLDFNKDTEESSTSFGQSLVDEDDTDAKT